MVEIAEFAASHVPRFADRREAGRQLAALLERERKLNPIVVGLARGGVQVAAEVARALNASLDVVAVRKVGHPWQPEYAIGAVTPGEGVYIRESDGLTEEQLTEVLAETRCKAAALDRRLHGEHPALDLKDRTVLVVDDGLATGATMIAALRWACAAGAERVVAAVPVAPAGSIELVSAEADEVVCPHVLELFFAVGAWYRSFEQLDDDDVIRLIEENRCEREGATDTVRAPEASVNARAP